jgi:hypothetical protein
MTVERGLFALDHRVVAVDPHSLVVMRNGKGEDLPMKLFLALHEPEQFHDPSNSESAFCRSAMSSAAAPHFTSLEKKGKYMYHIPMKKELSVRPPTNG